MERDCSIVRDLLPLYAEDLLSPETAAFMAEHLETCPGCRQARKAIDRPTPSEAAPDVDAAPLRRLRRAWMMKKVQSIVSTVAVMLALLAAVTAFLTTPEYLPYSRETVAVQTAPDGGVSLAFGQAVTAWNLTELSDPERPDGRIFQLEAYTSLWDEMTGRTMGAYAEVAPKDGQTPTIYFVEYAKDGSGGEARCISGTPLQDAAGWVVLPRLALGYYLAIAGGATVLLALAWFLLRKDPRVRRCIEWAALLPVSYLLGHLCVKGLHTLTYALQRDLRQILTVGGLLYCALLPALSLFYSLWERRDIPSEGEGA